MCLGLLDFFVGHWVGLNSLCVVDLVNECETMFLLWLSEYKPTAFHCQWLVQLG